MVRIFVDDFDDAINGVFLDDFGLEGFGHVQKFKDFGEGLHWEAVKAVFDKHLVDCDLALSFFLHHTSQ